MFSPTKIFSDATIITLSLKILLFYLIFSYFWKKRWLYYHGWKFPGPISFPIIGDLYRIHHIDIKNAYKIVTTAVAEYSPINRWWLDTLYIFSCRPHDVETVLTRCLDKGKFYFFANDYFEDTIIFASIPMWKKQRKIFNDIMKPKIVNTFVSIFSREARHFCDSVEEKKPIDVFLKMWQLGTNAACETIGGVNPHKMRGKKQSVLDMLRYEELLVRRFFNVFLHLDLFWKYSSLKKEVNRIVERAVEFSKQMFHENRLRAQEIKLKNDEEKFSFNKRLLTTLIETNEENTFSKELILRIPATTVPISSETSAVALSSSLLMLGMHPSIQDKVYKEIFSIFGNSDRDPTTEDLCSMIYLERVIKESLRLFPPIPAFLREVDQDIALDSYTLPKGSRFIVVLDHLHRNPAFWPDPLKFDPDRFLPERAEMRPRCAYIPFSVGSRNCPGSKYAMVMIKIAISTIIRRYKVLKPLDYKNVEEIGVIYSLVGKADKGYRIMFEKRTV